MSGVALRPYQVEARDAIAGAVERGLNSVMIALPTGTGKTLVFSDLIRQRGGSALILAHRDELLQQAREKLEQVAPELGMTVGFVQAQRNDVGAPIVIGSVATLCGDRRLAQLPKDWDTVIVDEAHHATAVSYRKILEHVNAGVIAGFTATPERHDKSRLADVFDEIVYARSLLSMIEEGYLCNLRGLRVKLEDLDLSRVKVSRGDYQAEDLGRALHDAEAPAHVAGALVDHAPERKSIVFLPTVELAIETAKAICDAGIPAGYVHGEQPKDERREVLRMLRTGELRAVANVDVLTEGYDEPTVDCIAIASPTRSRISYVQRVGRGTRIHPDKADCLILDLVGVTDDLKLQSLHDLFDLEGPVKKGETVTDAIDREAVEKKQREEGVEAAEAEAARRRASETDLFGRDRLHWSHLGDRWLISAGGSDLLVLDPVREGVFRVVLLMEDRARILARDLDLGYAQGAAEEAIRLRNATRLADKEAAWRTQLRSRGQLAYMRRLGITKKPETKGECSDLIDAAVGVDRLEMFDAAMKRREKEAVDA